MNVTLLYFDDCPNWLVADGHLRTLGAQHPEMVIERRIVNTVEEAEATQFRGSPSIMVDGVDPFADLDTPVACRAGSTKHRQVWPGRRRSINFARPSTDTDRRRDVRLSDRLAW
jgi:hypothetical protein